MILISNAVHADQNFNWTTSDKKFLRLQVGANPLQIPPLKHCLVEGPTNV